MGSLIRQHFKGIQTTTPINTPSFLIRYVAHEDYSYIDCPIIGKDIQVINPAKKHQRILVHVVYRDDTYAQNLSPWLRDGATKLRNRIYQLDLFFENTTNKTQTYLQWKEKRTLKKLADNDIENVYAV
jgi:hypothetical protein